VLETVRVENKCFNNIINKISDLNVIAYANQICNAYGVDTISAGVIVAFVMELFEKGIISEKDTGGLRIVFGDGEGLLKLLHMIVSREGFGDVFS